MNSHLLEITLPNDASIGDVLSKLEAYGVASIENFIGEKKLQDLTKEYFDLLDDAERHSKEFLKKGACKVARLERRSIDRSRYSLTQEVFSSSFMDRIAREYFSPYPWDLNARLYIQNDKDAMEFNDVWHIDPSRCLKFSLYLTETSKENGAMMYALGSHREGFYRLMYYKLKGNAVFPQVIPDNEVFQPVISLEASPGTLHIFEAAGIHRGGTIQQGKERRVMRGHTFSQTGHFESICKKLLLRSPFNAGRYNLVQDDCVNPRFRSQARMFD
jgi:hypothetical protein